MHALFGRTFWFAALIVTLCNIVVATLLGGYNTYKNEYDYSRGWEVVTDVFGGMIGMIFVLFVVAGVALSIFGLRKLWNKSKTGQFIVLCIVAMFAFLVGNFGVAWIGIEWNMFASLPLVLFVLVQTFLVTLPHRRALGKAEKKIKQLQTHTS